MTDTTHPTDDEDFTEQLSALLQRAHSNGVNVEGGWKCTIDGNGDLYWDVQITSVEYDS